MVSYGSPRQSVSGRVMMMDDEDSVSLASSGMRGVTAGMEIVLEGEILKLNRNKVWQNRYFVFYSNQVLMYSHIDGGKGSSKHSFHISKESGCEIGDMFVEQQKIKGRSNGKESLYCFTVTWPDDNTTVGSFNNISLKMHESFVDDSSHGGQPPVAGGGGGDTGSPGASSFRGGGGGGRGPPRPKGMMVRQVSSPVKSLTKQQQEVAGSSNSVPDLKRGGPARLPFENFNDPEERSLTTAGTPTSQNNGLPGWLMKAKSVRKGLVSSNKKPKENDTIPSFVSVKGKKHHHGTIHERSTTEEDRPTPPLSPFKRRKPPVAIQKQDQAVPNASSYSEEQEILHTSFENLHRQEKKAIRKKVVDGAKMAVAAGAAAGVGVITGGVGLVAGLAALGAAAAVGGTAGVAEVGLKRIFQRAAKLTIATTSFEETKLWKSTLDACLASEAVKESTWAQMFVADGRRTTTALLPHDLEGTFSRSRDESAIGTSRDLSPAPSRVPSIPARVPSLPKGPTLLFLRDKSSRPLSGSRWRPLSGGWASLLGPGSQGLRISQEERIHSEKVAGLAVHGSTCPPMKAQVVLKAPALDAFMCLMSYGRLPKLLSGGRLEPNPGQSASFQVLEKIDEHTDIVHMVCRKLYLFPSWTEPRDFVLFRCWRYETDGSYTICFESVEHASCPPRPDFVRGEMHQAYTIAPLKAFAKNRKTSSSSSGGQSECLLTAVTQVDPKGWVPTRPWSFLSNQTYADAFGISVLLQLLDIRDAIDHDRFLDVSPDIPVASTGKSKMESSAEQIQDNDAFNYDVRFSERERRDPKVVDSLAGLERTPSPLVNTMWAEPDANSFLVRGPTYKKDRVKINAGASLGRLVAVDLVMVDKPIFTGMSTHPNERVQMALQRERKLKELGKKSDMPPFVFIVNIVLPGPPFYHAVYYYAVDEMSTIDGTNGTGSSRLCQRFLFGDSDDFRDRTFKLIPQIVEGNFMVRKAVGSTPAIMGTKLQQLYVRSDRYMEVILNCGSSSVATGVIRLSLGYAKTLVVDMGFLLEGDEEDYLPERIFGCARMKHVEFGAGMHRKVEPMKEHAA